MVCVADFSKFDWDGLRDFYFESRLGVATKPELTIDVECKTEGQMLVKEQGKPIRQVVAVNVDDVDISSEHNTTTKCGFDRSDTKTMLDGLTQSAQAELEQLERVISKGLDAWYECGKAYETINQKKLYGVAGYKFFKHYCMKRWHKSMSSIQKYMYAARVKDEICEYIEIPPGNMTLYFELFGLPSLEAKVEVWDSLTANGKKPSQRAIREAVSKYLGRVPKPKTTATLKVTVEAAELIKASAKQAGMTTEDLISKLLAKVLE